MGRKKNDRTKEESAPAGWAERFAEVWGEYEAEGNPFTNDGTTTVGTGGRKDDTGKPPLYRGTIAQFPRALRAVAACSAHGADRYGWENWKSVPGGFERYSDAMVRHLVAESEESPIDHDSGQHHASHTAWNCLARLELLLIEMEKNESL